MRYDLNVVLKGVDGQDADDEGKPATMRTALARALVSDPQGTPPSGSKKLARYALFSKIATTPSEEPVDFTVNEVALAKEASDIWPTLIYGQIVSFLDQRT